MKKLKNFLIFFVISCILSIFVYDIVKANTIIYSHSIYRQDDIVNLIKNNKSLFENQINFDNDIVAISYNSNSQSYYVYTITRDITISNYNGYFQWGGRLCTVKPNSDYTNIDTVSCGNDYYPNTSYVSTFFANYFVSEFGQNSTIKIINNSTNSWTFTNSNNNDSNITLNANSQLNLIDVVYALNDYTPVTEPTYTYQETILESGNVKIDFTFANYTEENGYGFEIFNNTSNEYYGVSNPYTSVYNNIIPFGNSYSIEIPYDSLLYVTLASYERVEQTSLFYRTEIYTQFIDINNVVFENEQEPYFAIYTQNKNNITGAFINTTNSMTCWYSYSDTQTEDILSCNEIAGFNVHDNGYVEVIIKKGNNTIYSRKINYLGANTNEPYIIYEVIKRDFYSVVNWHIENELSNTTYRYSTNNGTNYTNWETYTNNDNIINVFDNSTIIIEIANNNQSTIYDSKAIVVINDITNIKNTNNTTTNFVNKFKSIFNVNSKILQNVENYYNQLRNSKIYLLIFIPFITSLICAIIYLIRRK